VWAKKDFVNNKNTINRKRLIFQWFPEVLDQGVDKDKDQAIQDTEVLFTLRQRNRRYLFSFSRQEICFLLSEKTYHRKSKQLAIFVMHVAQYQTELKITLIVLNAFSLNGFVMINSLKITAWWGTILKTPKVLLILTRIDILWSWMTRILMSCNIVNGLALEDQDITHKPNLSQVHTNGNIPQ
jgi:hypothetical protein